MVKEALFYETRDSELVCLTCERRCRLREGEEGFCGTRKNIGGKLFTLIYGDISSLSANPIEKKPLFHFHPGTKALTCGSWGCNFTCPWCQNYEISKNPKGRGEYISPGEFIKLTKRYGCRGTSISLNEPTLLLEYSIDIFRLAREEGLYNTFVTNGYMTEKALSALIDAGLDAANVDVKGDREAVRRYCGADVEKVWRNARLMKERGVWVEITTLVIPGVNDGDETLRGIARRIKEELGEETPWHVTRYHPAYEFSAKFYVPPTKIKTLERAHEIGKGEGLKFVYVGNVPGHPFENTYCPRCGELLIRRYIFDVLEVNLKGGRCPVCGEEIPIIF